jgi:hypothetical protein
MRAPLCGLSYAGTKKITYQEYGWRLLSISEEIADGFRSVLGGSPEWQSIDMAGRSGAHPVSG